MLKYFIDDLQVDPRTPVKVNRITHLLCMCIHVLLCSQGLGELLHLAVGKKQLDIVKYLVEHHNLDPTCAGQVRTMYNIHINQ